MPIAISALLHRCYTLILSAALILISVFTVNTPTVHAANIWTVNTLNDDAAGGLCNPTACTLRDALNSAANGDTIQFSVTGTILLGNAGTLILDKSVTIMGSGATKLAINGNKKVAVFTINDPITVSLDKLRIENGSGNNGGGIYNNGGIVIVSNTLLFNNGNYSGKG